MCLTCMYAVDGAAASDAPDADESTSDADFDEKAWRRAAEDVADDNF